MNDSTPGGEQKQEVIGVRREGWHFTQVENAVLENEGLSKNAKLVYVMLCYHADKEKKTCFPSMQTLGNMAGIKHRDTLKKAIEELVEAEYVEAHKMKSPTTGQYLNTVYVLKDLSHVQKTKAPCSKNEHGHVQKLNNNYSHTRLEPYNNNVYVSQALPDLESLKAFSKQNLLFKDVTEKDWKAILREANNSANSLEDVLKYVYLDSERRKKKGDNPIKNVGGYIMRCLQENWPIDFENDDPWYAYFTEREPTKVGV